MQATHGSSEPSPTYFINKTNNKGESYYINNNPWKLKDPSSKNKIYRYCVACGENRFDDNQWKEIRSFIIGLPYVGHDACFGKIEKVDGFVPSRHFKILTPEDRAKSPQAVVEGQIEESLPPQVTVESRDRVYQGPLAMCIDFLSAEAKPLVQSLEKEPLLTRIHKATELIVKRAESLGITRSQLMQNQCSDQVIKELSDYRSDCVKLQRELELSGASFVEKVS